MISFATAFSGASSSTCFDDDIAFVANVGDAVAATAVFPTRRIKLSKARVRDSDAMSKRLALTASRDTGTKLLLTSAAACAWISAIKFGAHVLAVNLALPRQRDEQSKADATVVAAVGLDDKHSFIARIAVPFAVGI